MANRDLFRIEMLILKILEDEDCYGYQLTQLISERTHHLINLKEGTLYPIMYRLSEHGHITERREQAKKRQVRIYYHLEPSGREHLQSLIDKYTQLTDAIHDLMTYQNP